MGKYEEAMDYLRSLDGLGSRPGLENIKNLMGELENIQDQEKVIHIAGTNGKGSVGAMLERVLFCSGYRTGHFSSPAVFLYEEMFRINGTPVEKESLAECILQVKEACQRLLVKGLPQPTRFEVETATAFLLFHKEACDYVIMECGMGGALDSTNVVKEPLCAILTSISYDHMQFLGETLEEIALQKAGIIKNGTFVVLAHQTRDEVTEVIRRVCKKEKAALYLAGVLEVQEEKRTYPASEKRYLLRKKQGHREETFLNVLWENISLSLEGCFQRENAACVLEAVHALRDRDVEIPDEAVIRGLATTCWPGRFEKLRENPLFYMDGAHNGQAARRLAETLEEDFTNCKIVAIMGVFRDKEYEKVLATLLPHIEILFTVTPPGERGLPAEELAVAAEKWAATGKSAATETLIDVREGFAMACSAVSEAVESALSVAGTLEEELQEETKRMESVSEKKKVLILACGSLSFLGEIKMCLFGT